ncbi:alpha/beta hydrolase family protein [Terriglobus saanensis]|uniref:Uncharacterized protein n=1 Tax=Terriglobus saanensis (strain ATCC BAA-1853 / DSM 23119 / SP1PR4) TaxID=401053 RepID=E8V079_TERSS|nr:acetylxylan esterase [Terriglobus saanensis]ADV83297.1 hypothetical protein AciPR4_2518 [Terriglobus saanensis SP1PR4]
MFRRFAALAFLALTLGLAHAQTTTSTKPSSKPAPVVTPELPETPAVIEPEAPPFKEDWTTLSLAKSGLSLDVPAAVLLNKVEVGGCTRELLRLQWRPGDPIDLYVIRPAGVSKPPVALFLLNYTFDTDVFRASTWCDQASQNKIAIASFGSALSWQRFHTPRPMKQWFVSELQEALSTSTHDVQMVLNYLEKRDDLDAERIGLFGQGSGGSIAILAAAADPRIRALHVVDPWGDWPDWLKGSKQIPEEERALYLKPEFLNKVTTLDPIMYLPQLKGKALRIQIVMSDPVTPTAVKDKIANAAPEPDQVIRYMDKTAEQKALPKGGISSWLAQQIYSDSPKTSGMQALRSVPNVN